MGVTAKRALSQRQAEIASLIASGKSSRAIGELLSIDARTVDSHVDAIRNKLGVRTRVELAVALLETGTSHNSGFKAADPGKTNLPLERTTLIGRKTEIADVVRLVQGNRLVTVTGTGGVGKSRAALAAADTVLAGLDSGAWLVELAPLTRDSSIATAIAQALGLEESGNRPIIGTLAAYLKHKSLLLILDNAEHVVAAAAEIADALLRNCAQLRILVTSRQPLQITGENVYRLPSLRFPTPEESAGLSAGTASAYSSIALFIERATARNYGFVLGDADAPIVAEICRRLDGIPLAIELASAQTSVFSMRELACQLDERFKLLTGGDRTAVPRHQTMRALIDWSYDLLEKPERMLLQRVGIFSGGWTLAAVETACSDASLQATTVAHLLSNLVDASHVVADHSGAQTRYRLLESVREYALEKLDASGERQAVARRHAQWVAAFADEAGAALWTMSRRAWLIAIVPEIDNTRAALVWAVGRGTEVAVLAGRIAAGLGSYLYYCGLAGEGRQGIESVLRLLGQDGDPNISALLWYILSTLRTGERRAEAARRAIDIFRRLDDRRRLGTTHLSLAIAYRQMARFSESEAAVETALSLFRQTGDDRSVYYASALGWRASAFIGLGRFDEARALFEEDIALLEAIEDEDRAAVERLNLAELEFAAGNVRRSLALVEEAIAELSRGLLATNVRNEHSQVVPYLNAAAYRLLVGDTNEALGAAREALTRARSMEYPLYTAIAVQLVATVAALAGDVAQGARLCGFVDEVLRAEGVEREPTEQRIYEMLMHALRVHLSDNEIERFKARGARLTARAALRVAFALRLPESA